MVTVNIAELKANLSRYLKQVLNTGERLLVLDRDQPVAEIGPIQQDQDPWKRLALTGAVRIGTQDWASLRISPLSKRVDVQALLDAVREDIRVIRYVDASAILRVVLDEPGMRMTMVGADVLASSRIVEVECYRTLDRARFTGMFDDEAVARKTHELGGILARVTLVEVTSAVIGLARASFPLPVRALDAIHVASAQWLAGEAGGLRFWTHDRRQGIAALSRGLDVEGVDLSGS